jgi:hypothetical protein
LLSAGNLATFMYRLSRNSESLNLLEPSGPVQAYVGIIFPSLQHYKIHSRVVKFVLRDKFGLEKQFDHPCENNNSFVHIVLLTSPPQILHTGSSKQLVNFYFHCKQTTSLTTSVYLGGRKGTAPRIGIHLTCSSSPSKQPADCRSAHSADSFTLNCRETSCFECAEGY